MRDDKFVFHDAGGGRWQRFKVLACVGAFLGAAALALFLQALFVPPKVHSPKQLKDLKSQVRASENLTPIPAKSGSDRVLSRLLGGEKPAPDQKPPPSPNDVRAAFFSGWDAAALRSLDRHQALLTHVFPEWLTFTDIAAGPVEDPDAAMDCLPSSLRILPVLSNLDGSQRAPEGIEFLMYAGKEERQRFISQLAGKLESVKAAGVLLDWEEVDAGADNELSGLVAEIADGLRARGLETWVGVTMDAGFSAWDFERLSPHVARFVALIHDENGATDPAGPIASQDWFDGWAEVISHCGPPEQWIASLGCHACDWAEGNPPGEQISFADAMSRAGNAGCRRVRSAAPAFNGSFSYFHEGKAHDVWFLDAASFANEWNAVRAYGFGGIAVNRLGLEDPAIWTVIGSGTTAKAGDFPSNMPGGDAITSMGAGEVVSLDPTVGDGRRTFSADAEGRISCDYAVTPAHPTLFRLGGGSPRSVAITFDDGPDPDWTPAILDILKERGVKAAFFVVGREAERYPEIVERIVAEGHEIGNHSYTHANLAELPDALVRLELNSNQRLIESLTGHTTTLFRPPYNADSRPTNMDEIAPIAVAESLGYLTVLENIDPKDWQEPDPDELLRRAKAARGNGNILLLHDGGGDRSPTVAALPAILDWLDERGDRVVSIGGLLGIDESKIMPPVVAEGMHGIASGVGFQLLHMAQESLHAFLVLGTLLVLARTILVVVLAHIHRPPTPSPARPRPHVSVLIPAFNEEKVIEKTVRSLLASDYDGPMEIVVVDDGSSDATADVVRGIGDPRVRLVLQPNAGKARALQNGADSTTSDILVFVDADTQFEKDAIRQLVDSFSDARIGAVSGHARVGNLKTFLARCQDLEYVSGFNLDRRAYAAWNCITVAPGAISAVRRAALVAAGGFSTDTLAEDTDLTLAIHKAGYRIEYQPRAIAHTEAPETFAALARQRFRWAYGTMQCAWKHRDIVFKPRYKALGWFSLPGIWFFQVALVAFSPFIDLLFLQSLLLGHADDVLPYFLVFLLCDVILAAAAVRIEGLPLRDALRIIPQRFLYRPLLSYVVWKSILHALRGAWVGWGKLQRTASVSLP
jgi:cellulose synthase/poly-beta-1,6-N-acetylglucosamine synthase-like glycosyltransferase/peptidoglycan/xylan/chitin deacetylase (PgdA/CDA1 family)